VGVLAGLCVPLAAFLAVDVCPGILLDTACYRLLLKSALHRNKTVCTGIIQMTHLTAGL